MSHRPHPENIFQSLMFFIPRKQQPMPGFQKNKTPGISLKKITWSFPGFLSFLLGSEDRIGLEGRGGGW